MHVFDLWEEVKSFRRVNPPYRCGKNIQKGLRLNLNQEASCCEATVLFQIIKKKKHEHLLFIMHIFFILKCTEMPPLIGH